ncbi:MAG: zf-HC2 domain-containing protein [Caldilineaceae bacterium]
MNTHQQIQRLLGIYRELTPAEQAAVDAHLQGCTLCAQRFAVYQQLDTQLRQAMQQRMAYLEQQPKVRFAQRVGQTGQGARPQGVSQAEGWLPPLRLTGVCTTFWALRQTITEMLRWNANKMGRPRLTVTQATGTAIVVLLLLLSTLMTSWSFLDRHIAASTPTVTTALTVTPATTAEGKTGEIKHVADPSVATVMTVAPNATPITAPPSPTIVATNSPVALLLR